MPTALALQPPVVDSSLSLEDRVHAALAFLRELLERHGFSNVHGVTGGCFLLLNGHGLLLDCALVDAGSVTGIQGRTFTRLSAATGSQMALRILITVGGLTGTSHISHVPLDEQQRVERDVVYNVLMTLRDHWKVEARVLDSIAGQITDSASGRHDPPQQTSRLPSKHSQSD